MRRVVGLTPDTIGRLPEPCRHCALWELGRAAGPRGTDLAAEQKEVFVAATTLEWGLAGMVVSVDGDPAGYALFGPAAMFAGPTGELTRPASRDAALLATMLIVPPYRGQGLGRVLLQSMARELTKRRVRRVEAFADRATGQTGCRLPAGFLERCGFVVVRDHPRVPLLRMDLRTTVRWKGVGELALDALRVPAKQALRPAPGAQPVAPASRSTVSRAPGELPG